MDILDWKLLWQRDPRGKNKHLGTDKDDKVSTIGGRGCLITNIAMLFNNKTKMDSGTPDIINWFLINNNGYHNHDLVIHRKVVEIFNVFNDYHSISCKDEPAPIDYIDNNLPLILKVDFDIRTSPVDGHFVVAVDKVNDDYLILDPGTGELGMLLDRYGKDLWDLKRGIFGVIKYT